MTKIINGKEVAQNLRNSLKKEIVELKNKFNAVPGLAVVQVGNVAASSVYVKAKTKSAHEVGKYNQKDAEGFIKISALRLKNNSW